MMTTTTMMMLTTMRCRGGSRRCFILTLTLDFAHAPQKSVSPPPFPPVPPPFSAREVEEMRCVLKFFFMDPIQKWKAKRRFPWKLCLQLLKIVFITVQLCLFGSQVRGRVRPGRVGMY